MARRYSPGTVRQLTAEHRARLDRLEAVQGCTQALAEEIRGAVDAWVTGEVTGLLRAVPVEELNRDRRGIKVKLLRENGYGTMADLLPASVYQLAAIRGIGEDSARIIRGLVSGMEQQTRAGVRIRISLDEKTPEAARVVRAVAAYRRAGPPEAECAQLFRQFGEPMGRALEEAAPAAGFLRWLFTLPRTRQRALQACQWLQDFRQGADARRLREALSAAENARDLGEAEAWEDFRRDSIAFFQLLETLVPGVWGEEDAGYGLPGDMAREIREEPLQTEGLRCALRRYQEWGVRYILHQGKVLLGDEMGLGKTVQAIAAMVSLWNMGERRFLVVCPAGVLANWCREVAEKSTLPLLSVYGPDRQQVWQTWLAQGGVAVTTYETTGLLSLPEAFRFSLLVVDEAHYIKNPETARCRHVKALGARADRLLFMTGTALENRVGEMVALIAMLRPSVAAQVREMAYLSAAPQFRHLVAPVYYRRKREDVLAELPQLTESREWCTLLPGEAAVYEDAVLAGDLPRMRQVSWNIPALSESSKARRLLELVREAGEDGRKILVFSFFLDTLRAVVDLLGDRCLNPIHGAVSPLRRQEILDEFERAPAGTVLAAQIQAGGTGLNIQCASVIILCEPQLKPSIENQAISRAYRMGQTRHVLVYRLLCEGTVDERLVRLLEEKQAVFDAFADESDAARQDAALDAVSLETILREEQARLSGRPPRTPEAALPAE